MLGDTFVNIYADANIYAVVIRKTKDEDAALRRMKDEGRKICITGYLI